MENLTDLQKIYQKYLSGTLTNEEQRRLFDFFDKGSDEDISEVIAPYLESDDEPKDLSHLDDDVARVFRDIKSRTYKAPKRRSIYFYVAAAAAIIAICSLPFIYKGTQQNVGTQQLEDLAPGKAGATLTLADGRRIALDAIGNGTVATQGAISINKNADGELVYLGEDMANYQNTLSTARGQTFNLTLPDGSKVWLNAASSIKYPASFASKAERLVEITGEAYFEVAHNKEQPFIVKSGVQRVKVLGTKFNVSSYADDPEQITTLAEGSVRVYPTTDAKFIMLTPGNEIVNGNHRTTLRSANLETALAWTMGKIYFKDASLTEVLKQVSRWYDVDIDYSTVKSGETFTGGIKRTAKLSELLRILAVNDVHCTLEKIDGKNALKVINK